MSYIPDLASLETAFCGHPAILVGNGPSINGAPFARLVEVHTFGMNRIAMLFNKTWWRPRYFVGVSSVLVDAAHAHFHQDFLAGVDRAQYAFCWDRLSRNKDMKTRTNAYYLRCSETAHFEADEVDDSIWSNDIQDRVSKFGSSMFAALQIAAWMGFDPLVIIGADGPYKHYAGKYDPNHFDPGYRGRIYHDTTEQVNAAHTKALEIAKVNLDKLGILVYDATDAEGWGVFPRRELEDVLYEFGY